MGAFFLCYQFAGENIVAFPAFEVRVAQVSAITPRFVVVEEENAITVKGRMFVEGDAFGFVRGRQCRVDPAVLVDSETVVMTTTFGTVGSFVLCMRLKGDEEVVRDHERGGGRGGGARDGVRGEHGVPGDDGGGERHATRCCSWARR